MRTEDFNCACQSSKQSLRAFYSGLRKGLGEAARAQKSLVITEYILSHCAADCDVVMAYYSIGSEVATFDLMAKVLASGRGLALPYCREDGSMGVGRIFNLDGDIKKGAFGTAEPKDELKDNIGLDKIGVCVCPGVAFDRYGTRLGRGRAFYDNFLTALKGRAALIGCAFGCQISERPLPADPHDVAMDLVVTENGAFGAICGLF